MNKPYPIRERPNDIAIAIDEMIARVSVPGQPATEHEKNLREIGTRVMALHYPIEGLISEGLIVVRMDVDNHKGPSSPATP